MKKKSIGMLMCMQIKFIFIGEVLHKDSFCHRGTRQQRSDLLDFVTIKLHDFFLQELWKIIIQKQLSCSVNRKILHNYYDCRDINVHANM